MIDTYGGALDEVIKLRGELEALRNIARDAVTCRKIDDNPMKANQRFINALRLIAETKDND